MESGKKTKNARPEHDDEPDEHSGVDSFKQVSIDCAVRTDCVSLNYVDLQVQHYAESTTLCRHVAICRYFGEKIDELNPSTAKNYCDNMCDVGTGI